MLVLIFLVRFYVHTFSSSLCTKKFTINSYTIYLEGGKELGITMINLIEFNIVILFSFNLKLWFKTEKFIGELEKYKIN